MNTQSRSSPQLNAAQLQQHDMHFVDPNSCNNSNATAHSPDQRDGAYSRAQEALMYINGDVVMADGRSEVSRQDVMHAGGYAHGWGEVCVSELVFV
jgi:hypothetical protein